MTAPGTSTPQPGRAAFAAGRAAVVAWSLLLVGLLALLPCAGTAKAAAEPLPTPVPVGGARSAAAPIGPHAGTEAEPPTPRRQAERRQAGHRRAESLQQGHHPTHTASQQASQHASQPQPPLTLCSADGDRPGPGSCSSHTFCGPEAQLPNAPPQPAAASLPQLVPVRALPCGRPIAALPGPDHAPDLHVLQVQRS